MGWEDHGRQDHGWFGTGTSGNVPELVLRPASADDLGRAVAREAAARLPPRLRREFEEYTGEDGGKTLLAAMRVWVDGAHLSPATFRRLLVGPGLPPAGAASLQALARALADPHDPAALAGAGAHLASALGGSGRNGLGYTLSYVQDMALYADANRLVPDRPVTEMSKPSPASGNPVAATAALAGTAVTAAPEGAGPWLAPAARFLAWALRAGSAPLVGATILFWPRPVGDGTIPRPLPEAKPDSDGSILYSKPSGSDGDKPRAGTDDRPPAGSKPIDETPWSGDHGEIKDDIIAGGKDDVRISPDGDVWSKHPDGSWTNEGPARNFVGSDEASGQRGKDRERPRRSGRQRGRDGGGSQYD